MSSQSKDNTCPTCGKSRTEMLSRYMAAGGKNTCPSCGSGQQEDRTPEELAEFFDDNKLPNMAGAVRDLAKLREDKPNVRQQTCGTAPCDNPEHEFKPTDSKPEKPCNLTDHTPVWAGDGYFCSKCMTRFTPPVEPSKPDQLDLAQIIIDAGQPWGLDENEAFFDALPAVKEALEALISQREQEANDRGVKDGKAAGSLAAFLEIKAYGSYALDRQYCDEPFIVVPVSELDEAISVFGDELKSKGEVKSEYK